MDYLKYIDNNNARFGRYSLGKKLYTGSHSEVFNINQYEYFRNPERDYIPYNFCAVLTDTFANLMWSEEPGIKMPDVGTKEGVNQKFVDDWVKRSSLMATLRECSEEASYAGDAVVRLRLDNGEVEAEQIDCSSWYPIYDPSNPKKATGHIIKYTKKVKEGSTDVEYWLLEIHTKGLIEWVAYRITDGKPVKMSDPMGAFSDELTGVLIDSDGNLTNDYKLSTGCSKPLVFHLMPLGWLYKSVWSAMWGSAENAVAEAEHAAQLSPIDPLKYFFDVILASAELTNGTHDRAVEFAKRSLRANRHHQPALRVLLQAQVEGEKLKDAYSTLRLLLVEVPNLTISNYLSMGSSKSATRKRFAEALRKMDVPEY